MTRRRRLLHVVFGCRRVLKAWSVMGNPIEQCVDCGQWYVTYGLVNMTPTEISETEMKAIFGEKEDTPWD